MATLSEMPVHERYLVETDPILCEAIGVTENIRGGELFRAYLLRKRLKAVPSEQHKAILEGWALHIGRSVGAWKSDLKWAYAIDPDDLLGVFAEEDLTQNDMVQRVGTSHLFVIAKARHSEDVRLTSREMAEWALRCYHNNLSVSELTDTLRDHDLLPPKRPSKLSPPTQSPTRAAQILRVLADYLETASIDTDLSMQLAKQGAKPIRVGVFLEWLGAEYRLDMPSAVFALVGEGLHSGQAASGE